MNCKTKETQIMSLSGRIKMALGMGTIALGLAVPAFAHVKWFAPYIVDAPPQPVRLTLEDTWFWAGIGLVLFFFIAARLIEKTSLGRAALEIMDWLTKPLYSRLDDFVRVMIGAFFVAIFAIGGIYLTPDLKTPAEWVSWSQLLIAVLVFSRKTQPFAGAGIILLWLVALRDYDLFHLLDYLALGVGVAAYLVLEASERPEWRKYRLDALRWGVAIALMWSSLEKSAYPDWFYPLVDEKPFLTFGMPRDVFIPMAGVAEFTMGFGLLWTPLIRRMSAMALFIIFNAAVYPFGRIDLIGHALIMAIIVAIVADQSRGVQMLPALKRTVAGIPAGLAVALVIFSSSYWGLHYGFYAGNYHSGAFAGEIATHSHSAEHPHGPQAPAVVHGKDHGEAESAGTAFAKAMDVMHEPMMRGVAHPDPDMAFVLGMIPHHQGAIDMAEIILKYGSDHRNHELAQHIIAAQQREIAEMRMWLEARGLPTDRGEPNPSTDKARGLFTPQ